MSEATVVSGVPVSSLYPDRYGLGRSKLYDALKRLSITPYREGKVAYLTLEQLQQLDRHLVHGETVDTFMDSSVETSMETSSPHQASIVPVEMATLPPALQLIVEAIAARMTTTPADPLLPQRQLQELCDRGWLATTSQLSKILGVRPRPQMNRYGFVLEAQGKQGREVCWQVLKNPLP